MVLCVFFCVGVVCVIQEHGFLIVWSGVRGLPGAPIGVINYSFVIVCCEG
jgi:hypothetical protein